MAVIHLPAPLAKRAGVHSLKIDESKLLSCLESVCKKYPIIEPYIFTANQLSPFVKVFINNTDSNKLLGLETTVKEGDVLQVVLPASGG